MDGQKEGSLRLITPGEIRLAKEVFGNTISWNKVWIHHDSYLPFGLQNKNTAMTPDGEIYFREGYRSDFSRAPKYLQHLFIHELSHVWQRERGMSVMFRGLVSWMVSYRYILDGRPLRRYPMEQQAQIIADYFLLKKYGYREWATNRQNGFVTLDGETGIRSVERNYEQALRGFPLC